MNKNKRMNLVMTEEEYNSLAKISKQEMRSMSGLIRIAIREYIKSKSR